VRRRRTALLRDKGWHVEGGDENKCQRYVRHKFAERGGDVLQICVFMNDIHIIGVKKILICVFMTDIFMS
jgi:hypothetical protein